MRKIVTIVIVVLVVVGFAIFLFKISPAEQAAIPQEDFDYSQVKKLTEPRPVDAQDHVQGNPNAKNTFIAYEDFQCPGCAAYNNDLKRVTSEFKDTKFVFRYYPLTQIHQNAVTAAYAGEAAGAQGKFWELHDVLFEKQAEWEGLKNPIDKFAEYASSVGVSDIQKFKDDITSKKFKPKVQTDLFEAMGLDLQGTPSFYFNGKPLTYGSFDSLKSQAEKLYIQ